jgi:hypothetical protein
MLSRDIRKLNPQRRKSQISQPPKKNYAMPVYFYLDFSDVSPFFHGLYSICPLSSLPRSPGERQACELQACSMTLEYGTARVS